MTLTLLLDLDDTLLESNMQAFLPAYFQALAGHLGRLVQPDRMLAALMAGTQRMLANDDPSRTLQQVFEADFYPALDTPKERLETAIEAFYERVFPTLGHVTRPRAGAAELVEWARRHGARLAIATDPLFPRKAIHHRIRWAGLEPQQFELIASFETFHFSKSHPAYLAEVLGRLGWPEGAVIMVGNDLERDWRPARRLGLVAYLVESASASTSGPEAGPRGTLLHLRSWLESTPPASLEPSFASREAILAILRSTPAVMDGLLTERRAVPWSRSPTPDDWAPVEIVCHVRDVEREIHHAQIKTLLEAPHPFIPRPDTAVWARERKYLDEDGPLALRQFTEARRTTLDRLTQAGEAEWSRQAQHAIFGPTNFQEVIGFMAEHDRMHVQQMWETLHRLA